MSPRKNHDEGFITTFTGKILYPAAPDPAKIDIRDIAHSLAQQCRWTGHTREFYSTAQHSVIVSYHCGAHALTGLLHDSAEAYIADLSKPLKYTTRLGEEYRKVEARLEKVIARKFRVPALMNPEVKAADEMMLWTEKRDLMVGEWRQKKLMGPKRELPERIVPWSPAEAERRFLARFRELTGVVPVGTDSAARAAASALPAPALDRPPNVFTLSEYATENKVSETSARNAIRRLAEAGKVRPTTVRFRQRSGRVVTCGAWELVGAAAK